MTGESESLMISQFYCELADQARQHGARLLERLRAPRENGDVRSRLDITPRCGQSKPLAASGDEDVALHV